MTICNLRYITCDNKDPLDVDYLLYLNTEENFISCGNHNGMDLARYDDFEIPEITNLQESFKMEFWFYTQSYVNYNFAKLTVTWDFHIKIQPYYDSGDGTFYVNCYPIPDNSTPLNDGPGSSAILGVAVSPPGWIYVNCGVNYTDKLFYVSNGYFPGSSSFTSKNTIPSDDTVSMYISEDSPASYGITYIRQMRLWNCYDCQLGLALAAYDYKEPLFDLVVHVFQFSDPRGYVVDMVDPLNVKFTDVNVQAVESVDYKGSNIVIPTPGISGGGSNQHPTGQPPTCLEERHFYYNLQEQKGCDSKFYKILFYIPNSYVQFK